MQIKVITMALKPVNEHRPKNQGRKREKLAPFHRYESAGLHRN